MTLRSLYLGFYINGAYLFPDDHSRVILPLIDDDENSDYVNASYLHVCETVIVITFNSCVTIGRHSGRRF